MYVCLLNVFDEKTLLNYKESFFSVILIFLDSSSVILIKLQHSPNEIVVKLS